MEGSGSFHTPAVLLQGKNTCTHLTGYWISGRASLKFAEKRKILCVRYSPNAEFDNPAIVYHGDLAKKKKKWKSETYLKEAVFRITTVECVVLVPETV
jgi:hypothetical protein